MSTPTAADTLGVTHGSHVEFTLAATGPPLYPRTVAGCFYCGDAAHDWPATGSACPVRFLSGEAALDSAGSHFSPRRKRVTRNAAAFRYSPSCPQVRAPVSAQCPRTCPGDRTLTRPPLHRRGEMIDCPSGVARLRARKTDP